MNMKSILMYAKVASRKTFQIGGNLIWLEPILLEQWKITQSAHAKVSAYRVYPETVKVIVTEVMAFS